MVTKVSIQIDCDDIALIILVQKIYVDLLPWNIISKINTDLKLWREFINHNKSGVWFKNLQTLNWFFVISIAMTRNTTKVKIEARRS